MCVIGSSLSLVKVYVAVKVRKPQIPDLNNSYKFKNKCRTVFSNCRQEKRTKNEERKKESKNVKEGLRRKKMQGLKTEYGRRTEGKNVEPENDMWKEAYKQMQGGQGWETFVW